MALSAPMVGFDPKQGVIVLHVFILLQVYFCYDVVKQRNKHKY